MDIMDLVDLEQGPLCGKRVRPSMPTNILDSNAAATP